MEDEFAGVLGVAHHTDGGGRLDEGVMGALRHRQLAGCGQAIDRAEQVAQLFWVCRRQQPQVYGVEGQVAPEGKEPQLGVTIDVALANLDEPSPEGEQFQPGKLRGAGHRVEHDIDTPAVSVPPNLLGELDAARVIDMLNTHVAQ
ncbi:Uncharacterised protein [Mycobacterium tuberculosis]|nr:Uncharacterised protein [Mycobacterium tuberculosis]